MTRTSMRRALLPAVATLAITLSACSASNETATDGASGSGLSGSLAGGGATSQEKAQGVWRAGFQTANPGVSITYDSVGSTDGRANFIKGATSYAGTDSALADEDLTGATARCSAQAPIQIPAYVSPIAVAYNLPGVDALKLDAATIAKIFANKITTWNDPAIAALNEGVTLPASKITPVHRQDGSGTTKNFTDYLNKVAPAEWANEGADDWPLKGGEAAEGTSGVVERIKGTEGTIGYADLSATTGLGLVSVKVGEEFVEPSATGAAAALEASPKQEGRDAVDMAFDIDRTTTAAGAYPVFLVSYLIACQTYEDANTADLVKGFLTYIVSSEGQQAAAAQAGSAPLSETIASEAAGIVGAITAG